MKSQAYYEIKKAIKNGDYRAWGDYVTVKFGRYHIHITRKEYKRYLSDIRRDDNWLL